MEAHVVSEHFGLWAFFILLLHFFDDYIKALFFHIPDLDFVPCRSLTRECWDPPAGFWPWVLQTSWLHDDWLPAVYMHVTLLFLSQLSMITRQLVCFLVNFPASWLFSITNLNPDSQSLPAVASFIFSSSFACFLCQGACLCLFL